MRYDYIRADGRTVSQDTARDYHWRANDTRPTVTLFESQDYYDYRATWRSYVVYPSES